MAASFRNIAEHRPRQRTDSLAKAVNATDDLAVPTAAADLLDALHAITQVLARPRPAPLRPALPQVLRSWLRVHATFQDVDATVAWAAVGAMGSGAAAGVAALAAWQSHSSAREANKAADTLAAIERDRRHGELTPQFEITLTAEPGDADRAILGVRLKPGRLERLDEVTISILDDGRSNWAGGLPDGVTQEEADTFVWGPWQFGTGFKHIESSRATTPRPYSVVTGKNWGAFLLKRTQPGRWMSDTSQEVWRRHYKGKPVRLLLTCQRDNYRPWFIQRDVEVTAPPRPGAHD